MVQSIRTLVNQPILVVGAGFAGAVYARILAEAGLAVDVIDRRSHVGGNAYDERSKSSVRVHRYGPHLFHTNLEHVVAWLSRFARFVPYEHRVEVALVDGTCVPLPINRRTVNTVFGVSLVDPEEVEEFLLRVATPIQEPCNAAEYLYSRIGTKLTNIFFRPYTHKMWKLDLEDLSSDIVKRIPLRFDDEDRYFPGDRFQLLPADGYTALFYNILDHPRVTLHLNTPFDRSMLKGVRHCFNSMAIDEFYQEAFGPLPYRSIRFHHREVEPSYQLGSAAQVNFADDGPYTRETDWSRLPLHSGAEGSRTVTLEEPCDYRDNSMERYYPVKTSDGKNDATYRLYCGLAAREANLTFIGRCGTYQYLDMHQVINQSLMGVQSWLAAKAGNSSS